MRKRLLFSFLPLISVGAIASPFLTSCNKNHGQSYSSLTTYGEFTIKSGDDANNIKKKALSFLPIESHKQITISDIPVKTDNMYWEFVYELGNYFKTSDNKVKSIELKNCNATSFDLIYKDKNSSDYVTVSSIQWSTSNVYLADNAKIYIWCVSDAKLPNELKSKFISQTYINCATK